MSKVAVCCPECSKSYAIDQKALGRKGQCKKCGTTFVLAAIATKTPGAADTPAKSLKKPPADRTPVPAEAESNGRGLPGTATEDNSSREWRKGDVILDLYEVKGVLGKGGMGTVYKVHHGGWNVELAVKTPLPKIVEQAGGVENFEREAETWVNLGLHPHTVSCYYVRRLGGIPRVFAEYVEGGSLHDWIKSRKLYAGGPESALERILDIAIQFAWGLHYAHEQKLIHQDVKPANVLMTKDGTAKVTDFGLANARTTAGEKPQAAAAGRTLVVPGAGLMTTEYASPEQAAGQPLTRRTDLWSWGVSLLEMFTGDVTWYSGVAAAESLEGYLDAGGSGDECIPLMPSDMSDLLKHCFQLDPAHRPKDMLAAAATLQAIFERVTGKPYSRQLPEPAKAVAATLNNRAVSLLDLGKLAECEKILEQALEVDPLHPESTYNLCLVRWRSARMVDVELIRRLYALRASHAGRWIVEYLLAQVHLERGDVEAAISTLEAVSKSDSHERQFTVLFDVARQRRSHSAHCLRNFEGHTDRVSSVSISPDGRWGLSGNHDTTLRLWELATGRCLRTFEGHTSKMHSVSISPDGRWGLSGSQDHTPRLWELATGRCLRTFEGHTKAVLSVSISPDGRWALSGSYDKTLRLWELATGRCLRTFEGQTKLVDCVSISPDVPGGSLRAAEARTKLVNCVSISPDGRWGLSGSYDNTLRLWELDWQLEERDWADWDDGVRPYVVNFLTLHTPCAASLALESEPTQQQVALALTRRGKPTWTEDDFQRLLDILGCAGYGWLRPAGVRRELENMAANWQVPRRCTNRTNHHP